MFDSAVAVCAWEGCPATETYDPDAWKCPPTWGLVEWLPPGEADGSALVGQAILCPAHFTDFFGSAKLRKP
jgi:hypothetical protein